MNVNKTRKIVRTPVLILICSLTLVIFSPTIIAAGIGSLCDGTEGLTTGQWASYSTDAGFMGMKTKVKGRYAIVATEDNHYWMEIESAMPVGDSGMIIKILIPGWPYTNETVKRSLMQMPRMEGMDAMPPMEMSPGSSQMDSLSGPIRMACEEIETGVLESVTVEAGTFNATRISLKQLGKDIWLSTTVPFGIVQLVDEQGDGVELIAYGSDAEPAITEMP